MFHWKSFDFDFPKFYYVPFLPGWMEAGFFQFLLFFFFCKAFQSTSTNNGLIDFNGMWNHLGLFYAKLKNHVNLFTFFHSFFKVFLDTILLNTIVFKLVYLSHRKHLNKYYHSGLEGTLVSHPWHLPTFWRGLNSLQRIQSMHSKSY